MRATKKKAKKMFLSPEINLFFLRIFILFPEIDCFFRKWATIQCGLCYGSTAILNVLKRSVPGPSLDVII